MTRAFATAAATSEHGVASRNSGSLILQRECACKGKCATTGEHAPDFSKQPCLSSAGHDFGQIAVQPKLTINEPGDRFEQEADRMADLIANGATAVGVSSVSPLGGTSVQRDGEDKQKQPKPNNYDEAAKKIGDAFLETKIGKKLKAEAEEQGEGFLSSVEGKVVAGGTLGTALAVIIATNSELPVPIPEIPLDFIKPGLKAKLTYEGPVRNPTNVGLTLTSKSGVSVSASYTQTAAAKGKPAETKAGLTLTIPLGGSPAKPKSKESVDDKYRAETARMEADQRKFREGLKTPAQKAQEERDKKAFLDSYFRYRGNDPLNPLNVGKKKDDLMLMRKASGGSANVGTAPLIVHETLAGSGQPLDRDTRTFMERRFGHDFGRVRIHTDAKAAKSARAVNARAYTVGHDIVLGEGSFAPATDRGRKLLAHELAHVVQQSGDDRLGISSKEKTSGLSPNNAQGGGAALDSDPSQGRTMVHVRHFFRPQSQDRRTLRRQWFIVEQPDSAQSRATVHFWFDAHQNLQVASGLQELIWMLQDDMKGPLEDDVKKRAEEWIQSMEGWIPYFQKNSYDDQHMPVDIDSRIAPLVDGKIEEYVAIREQIQKQNQKAAAEAVSSKLWDAREAAGRAANSAEEMQLKLNDALQAAFREGSESTLKKVVDANAEALELGLKFRDFAQEFGRLHDNLVNALQQWEFPAGEKSVASVTTWVSQGIDSAPASLQNMFDPSGVWQVPAGEYPASAKILSLDVSKYTDMLEKISNGLTKIDLAMTILDRNQRATQVQQGMKDINDAVTVASDIGSLAGISANYSMVTAMYIKPALEVITKELDVVTELASQANKTSISTLGELIYPGAEAGGEAMFEYMKAMMRADSVNKAPVPNDAVEAFLREQSENLGTAAGEKVPTNGRGWMRDWLYRNRQRVWAMLYGSAKLPVKPD